MLTTFLWFPFLFIFLLQMFLLRLLSNRARTRFFKQKQRLRTRNKLTNYLLFQKPLILN